MADSMPSDVHQEQGENKTGTTAEPTDQNLQLQEQNVEQPESDANEQFEKETVEDGLHLDEEITQPEVGIGAPQELLSIGNKIEITDENKMTESHGQEAVVPEDISVDTPLDTPSPPLTSLHRCGLTLGPTEWGVIIGVLIILFPRVAWFCVKMGFRFVKLIS